MFVVVLKYCRYLRPLSYNFGLIFTKLMKPLDLNFQVTS